MLRLKTWEVAKLFRSGMVNVALVWSLSPDSQKEVRRQARLNWYTGECCNTKLQMRKTRPSDRHILLSFMNQSAYPIKRIIISSSSKQNMERKDTMCWQFIICASRNWYRYMYPKFISTNTGQYLPGKKVTTCNHVTGALQKKLKVTWNLEGFVESSYHSGLVRDYFMKITKSTKFHSQDARLNIWNNPSIEQEILQFWISNKFTSFFVLRLSYKKGIFEAKGAAKFNWVTGI
jgi:hypothetical protein